MNLLEQVDQALAARLQCVCYHFSLGDCNSLGLAAISKISMIHQQESSLVQVYMVPYILSQLFGLVHGRGEAGMKEIYSLFRCALYNM